MSLQQCRSFYLTCTIDKYRVQSLISTRMNTLKPSREFSSLSGIVSRRESSARMLLTVTRGSYDFTKYLAQEHPGLASRTIIKQFFGRGKKFDGFESNRECFNKDPLYQSAAKQMVYCAYSHKLHL